MQKSYRFLPSDTVQLFHLGGQPATRSVADVLQHASHMAGIKKPALKRDGNHWVTTIQFATEEQEALFRLSGGSDLSKFEDG